VYPGLFVRGRTEVMRLHTKARKGETIQYVDIMSLYPCKCRYFKFPLGHTVIHVGDACKGREACLRKVDLVKCLIVPPERLYHPLLPFRSHQKLMFCPCRAFVITSNTGEWCHTADEERSLTGARVICELRLAEGYRILEVYEYYKNNVTR